MTDDYNIGTTLGIVGAGVGLYALKGVVDQVQNPIKPKRGKHYKRGHQRKPTVHAKHRDQWGRPIHF